MKLADLRRLAVRKQLRIRFLLPEGAECVIDEQGIARVPQLRSIPAFNIEAGLAQTSRFQVESADPASKTGARQSSLSEVEQLIASLSPSAVAAADHDE